MSGTILSQTIQWSHQPIQKFGVQWLRKSGSGKKDAPDEQSLQNRARRSLPQSALVANREHLSPLDGGSKFGRAKRQSGLLATECRKERLQRMISSLNASGPGLWTFTRGEGPIIATAIHDGTLLRDEVAEAMALAPLDRLREEDPYTGRTVTEVENNIVVHRSRFEFDLNRGTGGAIYETPDQSWGLQVWRGSPERALFDRSLALHAAYYRALGDFLDGIANEHDQFVLLDVHSYNHRRGGPDNPPTRQAEAPDVNIGTFSMPREEWAFLLDPLIEAMRAFDFNGRRLDVRENVAFQGKGEQTRFVHERYPLKGCAIAIEFKKFFMDEWSGEPDQSELDAMRRFITMSANTARTLLE